MAVTTTQLEAVILQNPFRQRLEFALVATAENICSEAAGTALHAQRKNLAQQIMLSPDNFVTDFAQGVVAQLNLSTTSMVGTTDVDTTDAALQTTISSIFNDYFA